MFVTIKRLTESLNETYTLTIPFSIVVILLVATPVFAQQPNFIASLSGQNLSPPVSTSATGAAKFVVDNSGSMAYEIDAKNIIGVIGAHISLQNGTDLAQVFNPYVEINGKSGIPTGMVNGQLSKGVITQNDLSGPLIGKSINELSNLMKNKEVYVVIRTQGHENGEIQGLVTPSNTSL